jgi:nucleoside-diphosphate-sugar epimerase
MKVLVIGCGYVGLPLALSYQNAGNSVVGWVNSQEGADVARSAGMAEMFVGDVAEPGSWARLVGAGLFDLVIHCASSNRGGSEIYERVFRRGWLRIVQYCAKARLVCVSSTSVYGQKLGELVDEESPAEPSTETGKILREAEELARKAGAIIARSAGIYGPGRAIAWEKFLAGTAVLEGDGQRWMNQIHRDDLVEALRFLAPKGEPGALYNVTDNEPVRAVEFYRWCSQVTGRPLPPFGPENPSRKRGLTHKGVSNSRLRALGWSPRYPSFREGLAAILGR